MALQLLKSLPSLTLEVAFANDPLDGSPTWTDITAYLMTTDEFGFRRGKAKQLDGMQPGTFHCVLKNADRRFDPVYSAGAYYPNLVPRKRIRLSAVWSGTTYRMFDGYVDDWAQESRGPTLSVCVVTATDAFKLFALNTIDSVWAATLRALDPLAWYRLGESDPSPGTVAADQQGRYDGLYVGRSAGNFGAGLVSTDGLIAGDPDKAVVSAVETDHGTVLPAWGFTPSGDFTWGYWARHLDPSYASVIQLVSDSVPTYLDVGLDFDGTGFLHMAGTGFSDSATLTSAVVGTDGLPHMIVGQRTGTTAKLYVDGQLAGSESVSAASYAGVGIRFEIILLGFDVADEAFFFSSVVSASDIAALYDAGVGWTGDHTGDRVGRVLDLIGWPAARRDIDTGISLMQAAQAGSAFDMIGQADTTEQGYCFIDGSGDVTFRNRHYRLLTTTNAFTFSDTSATYPYSDLSFAPSEPELRNDARYSAPGLTTQTAEDATSITAYGRSTYERTVYSPNTGDLKAGAEWTVTLYKDPVQRIDHMEVLPQAATATLWPAVLSIEIGSRLRVQRKPQGVGSTITQDVFVEQVAHSIQGGRWVTAYDLSPVSAAETTGFWVEGTTKAADPDARPAF